MRRGLGRTTWAALIAAAAIGVPSAAWFVTGIHAARQEAERIADAPREQALREAERLARQVAVRLESLRHSESRRSFLDYRPHTHDLPGECGCEDFLHSPLEQGPADPLVWAHFELDEVGQLTLPSLADELPGDEARDSARRALSDERAIFEVLECAGDDRSSLLPTTTPVPDATEVQTSSAEWVVTVGPFQWHRVSLEQQPALVALRPVSTPVASLTQGFVIRRDTLERLLDDAAYPARIEPGPPRTSTGALVPIDGEPWTIAVDASSAISEAADRAAAVTLRFSRNFALVLIAALAGGGLVVGLVWQAERLARQRARFAASAAHELRTPLAGLRMYGEMLADASGDPRRRAGYAQRIAGEAERLGRVVSNLLGYSRLERGELKLRTDTGDLGRAVADSLARLRPACEANGATLDVRIADALPPTRFDPDAVHQILQNLLDNAARYGRDAPDRTIHVVVERDRSGPRMAVIDHGPGVEPSLRGKLFQAFVRHPSPDAPDGLGLGLALVEALARAQHATVTHADEPGGGSRFTVTFPAVGDPARSSPLATSQVPRTG